MNIEKCTYCKLERFMANNDTIKIYEEEIADELLMKYFSSGESSS